MTPVRVIQWATGPIGAAQLREVIDHPEFELAGVFVYDPAKVGIDAATLVGRPPAGIVACHDKSAILALDADVVLHAASKSQIPRPKTPTPTRSSRCWSPAKMSSPPRRTTNCPPMVTTPIGELPWHASAAAPDSMPRANTRDSCSSGSRWGSRRSRSASIESPCRSSSTVRLCRNAECWSTSWAWASRPTRSPPIHRCSGPGHGNRELATRVPGGLAQRIVTDAQIQP